MRGEKYLTRKAQYDFVYTGGSTWTDRRVVVKTVTNEIDITRYGFVVSRRVGNAVVRNRVKRRLREILRDATLKPGWDIVIIARTPAAQADYHELENSVHETLHRAGIIVEEDESDCSGND